MAAVSAQYGLASSSSNTKGHQVHNFDNQADRSDDDNDDNSDAYSFEARSEAGDGASATAPGSDAVRPDSLTLTSPLEQLTRSLSFNKKEGSHGGRNGTPRTPRYRQHTPSDLPPVEQVMLEYLAGEPTQEASASTYETYDQWPRKATDTTHQQHSKLASRSAHQEQASEPANLEPVYFGDDDEPMVAEDPSEGGQGQLISAFRSSYHTYMTRSGGMRDSSYSWMAPDADSPNATLDFKQAELSHSQSANNKDSSSDVDRFEDHQGDRNRREFDPDGYEQWDAESKARARASSLDSQAAKTTGLHRIPSQKTSKTPMDGRASEMSAFEPFQYSSYESALRASKEAKQRNEVRASNWTSLTDATLQQESAPSARPLSTVDGGSRPPSTYAYAVDSPSMLQGTFAGPSRIVSAAPIPLPRSHAGRTNFSRPHDTMTSDPTDYYHDTQYVEQLSHSDAPSQPVSQQHRAPDNQGYSHPSRLPYDSVYSAYTQTSDDNTPWVMPQAPFQGTAASRPGSSPSSSSNTTLTIQDINTSTRPDMQTLDSYSRSRRNSGNRGVPAESAQPKRHKRTPSQVLASAIAKHRSQRAAAGLTTEGQYYVDPKSKKYYFVADSGRGGGSALSKTPLRDGKENDKPKERRKLHKKEAGWEITAINPSLSKVASPPRTPQQEERDRSLSLSGRSTASGRTSEEAQGSGSKWKIWSSNRSNTSNQHLPKSSPSQNSTMNRDRSRQHHDDPADSSLELIAEVRALTSSAKPSSSPGSRQHGFFGIHPSSQSSDPVMLNPSDRKPSFSFKERLREEASHPTARSPSSGQGHNVQASPSLLQPHTAFHGHSSNQRRPLGMERSDSVYSNYSYYEMPTDQGYISSTRASPIMNRSQSGNRSEEFSHAPLPSPYIPPTNTQYQPSEGGHSRQPSTTLDKAKHSMKHSVSLQLMAPAKHQNLTVPKGHAGEELDLAELARMNPNDPLVCLHFGIDAHERGNLEESAMLFQKSAKGGCGLGMLMYGLSLRHGWGCESDPETGFRYLQQAAESVVQNLDRVISGHIQLSEQQMEEQSAKSELVLSIYELGQCFLRGWGVAKDKKTALQYFTLAANLGDPDAQSELGFCYSTGRGCKKDLKKAAKYYRLAAKQGQISYGMQWIFKSKYDD